MTVNKREMGRYWGFICYPESMPEWNLIVRNIRELGHPIALSPLHDKDIFSDYVYMEGNDIYKKEHYHGIVDWENTTTKSAVEQAIMDIFNGTRCIRLGSPIGMYRYHCHLDNPEKFLYSDSERLLFNNFNIDDIVNDSNTDRIQRQMEIDDFCEEKGIFNYALLLKYLRFEGDIEKYSFVSSHTFHYKEFLKALKEMRTND